MKRKTSAIVAWVGLGLSFGLSAAEMQKAVTCDLVIYGGSSAGIAAAVQAKRMGLKAVVISPESRIGGLTTGGLGQTDIGNKRCFGGIALEFYRDVATYYRDPKAWTREKMTDYSPDGQCFGSKGADSMWTFEPSAARTILEGWEKRDQLQIVRGERLNRAKGKTRVENGRIVSIETESGRVFCGKMFVDATYEGDLMAAAGVSYTVGREANAVYGETLNGIQRQQGYHKFQPKVSAYVIPDDPKSGFLPNVAPDTTDPDGTGDKRVQAYCFRMCLTDDPANRIPFAKPANYNPLDYELLIRNLVAQEKNHPEWKDSKCYWHGFPWINSRMPNRKTDTNNKDGFSTDFIGRNWNWPEASYAERAKILKEHLDYQRGLMWTLANEPRIPERIRTEVARWGTCKDEFPDGLGDGWQDQLYVREGRRMIGDYVMNEHNCRGERVARHPVAMGAYSMDSHHVRRYADKAGYVQNEGDVEVNKKFDGTFFEPYGIEYAAILPKRAECGNLFVPVCLSASHIAFGSIRMEPVFFALGQVASTAAALAIADGVRAQDVDYCKLAQRLAADGQVLALNESVVFVEAQTGALEKAQEAVRAARAAHPDEPITVTLASGEYRLMRPLSFGAEDSGRPNAPVVWRGEAGAVIRGGVDIGPWADEGNGVVSAAIPTSASGKPLVFDMLFVNGVRAERSVLPKGRGTFKIPGGEKDSWTEVVTAVTNEAKVGEHTSETIVYAREFTRLGEDAAKILDAVAADELDEAQLQVLLDWSQARRRIVGWNRAERILETACFGGRVRHAQYRWCDRSRIRFENLRAGFTDPGDWLYDAKNGKIRYRLRAGESAATLKASAPARRLTKLLCVNGAHDLRFENVAFELSDAPQAQGDDPEKHTQIWQGQSARTSDATVDLAYCVDVAFENCRVARTGNYGFRIGTGCRRVTLARCETWDTGAGAVWMGANEIYPSLDKLERRIIREMYPESCASNVITDCTFRHGGRFHPEGTAIFVTYASDNLITHNLIDDFYYSGITLGYIWGYKGSPTQRNEVSFNRISRIGQRELFDLSGIYTLSASYGTVISNNVVTEVGGHGIYMDEGSEGVLIENNLGTHIDEAGAFMHYGSGCTFRNNIFAYNRKHGLAWASRREAAKVPSSMHFLGNIFLTEDAPLIGPRTLGVDGVRAHNVWWNPKGTKKDDFDGLTAEDYLARGGSYGDIVADPLFVNPKGGDFRLKPESPALRLGFREWDISNVGPRSSATGGPRSSAARHSSRRK